MWFRRLVDIVGRLCSLNDVDNVIDLLCVIYQKSLEFRHTPWAVNVLHDRLVSRGWDTFMSRLTHLVDCI